MDAALEIAVARQHRRNGQVGLLNGFLDRLQQRTGVANAGGAAVTDQIEAQGVEVLGQTRCVVIIGHHFGTGSQRAFHPRLAFQAFLDGFFATSPAAIMTLGLEVLVQDVIAAITTAPSFR